MHNSDQGRPLKNRKGVEGWYESQDIEELGMEATTYMYLSLHPIGAHGSIPHSCTKEAFE